ncbi:CHASE2 domain-containing protein [bacterium]|nr:CHASE2 domain-containing protein [bacterium]
MASPKLPGARAARFAAWKKHLRSLKIGLGIGLGCGVAVILAGFMKEGFLARAELLSLDWRYRSRPQVPLHPQVGNINYDDASLALFGAWPWPRSRQVALVTVMDFYDAGAVGYDVFFTEKNDIIVADRRLKRFVQDVSADKNAAAAERATHVLRTSIRDYDREFARAIEQAGNIYLGCFVEEPDKIIADGGIEAIRKYIAEYKLTPKWQKKAEAVLAAASCTVPLTPELEKSLFKMTDLTAPLPALTRASSGVGFAQIAKDFDHTVRLYPLFLYFDEAVYPSIVCIMISKVVDVPLDRWVFRPGEYIEIPDAKEPGADMRQTIRIPVNSNNQMLTNWAGKYDDIFLHLPFHLVSEYYAYFTAKQIARQGYAAAAPASLPAIRQDIYAAIDEEKMVTDVAAHRIAEEIAVAHVASPLLRAGKSPSDVLSLLPAASRPANAEATLQALAAALGTSKDDAGIDPAWKKEIERNVAWFSGRDRLADVEPLFFPPTRQVLWNGRWTEFSPVDIENKIFMVGLTGVGTIDLNPMPFESVSPMVGLHTSALNTLLTRQFLKFPEEGWRYPLDLAFALVTAVVGAVTTPFIGFLSVLMLIGAYSYAAYWAFAAHGQWIPWIEPCLAGLLTFVVIVVFHFIEAAREKGKVRALFAAMVSPAVLKLMEENPDRFSLTGVRKPGTMLFSAIEKFGKVTQGVAPDELGGILSLYLTPTSEIIMDYQGYIDKYEGHVIMADFGVPLDDPGHHWKCSYSALEQQQDIDAFQFFVKARYGVDVYVTMGVNSGYVSAGNMGSEKKMQYTVMGDAVNMSARFRPANLIYDTRIIIGEASMPLVKDFVEVRLLDKLLAKGKTIPITIYELQGWQPKAYLDVKGGDPIPPSLTTRWAKCPPEKIFGYQRFWHNRGGDFNHPLIPKIAQFFESQTPLAEELIKLQGRYDIQKYYGDLQTVREEASKIVGQSVDGEDPAGKSWDVVLDTWAASGRKIVQALEEKRYLADMMSKEDYAFYTAAVSRATAAASKLQSLKTRLAFHAETESIVERFMVDVHEAVEQIASGRGGAPTVDEAQMEAKREEYRSNVGTFIGQLDPKEYHEMMAVAGTVTDRQKQARELFEAGVHLQWERRWDEALAKFRAVLDIIPADGPSKSYIGRVEGYKTEPPGEKWQGEFVQKKK